MELFTPVMSTVNSYTPTISEDDDTFAAGLKDGSLAVKQKMAFLMAKDAIENARRVAERRPPPEAIPIMDIANSEPEPDRTLLGNRWLCEGGAALMVGHSGAGKSSISMQQDLCWAVGKEAFGIVPTRPLKILTIQAENDLGDLQEMTQGVLRGLGFSREEEEVCRANVLYAFEQGRTGDSFLAEVVKPLLEKHRPNLLRIDPLAAFSGADITQAKESAHFLREGLNPLLTEYGCGLIMVHHTPKTTSRNTKDWKPADWMYAGAGSADIVNWCRAAIIIDACDTPGVYRFIAAKRGNRIGWIKEDGQKESERWYKWATGSICWESADPAPAKVGSKGFSSDECSKMMMSMMPDKEEAIEKDDLLEQARDAGIGRNRADATIKRLIKEKALIREEEKRKGARAQVMLRRAKDSSSAVMSKKPEDPAVDPFVSKGSANFYNSFEELDEEEVFM